MTEHIHYIVNDVSSIGISAQPKDSTGGVAIITLLIRGGTSVRHVLRYLGHILHQ